jgi:hypothetical protein
MQRGTKKVDDLGKRIVVIVIMDQSPGIYITPPLTSK